MQRKTSRSGNASRADTAFGEEEMAAFGRELRRLRTDKGWSLQRMATESGISVAGIQKIERGTTNPSLQTALSLSEALGQPLPDLVNAAREAMRSVTLVHGSAPRQVDGVADLSLALNDRSMRSELLALGPKGSVEDAMTKAPLFVYVLEGNVVFHFGDGRFEHLRTNDAIHLKDELPTRIENSIARRSLLLCVSDLRTHD